jgi:hypothetical protein
MRETYSLGIGFYVENEKELNCANDEILNRVADQSATLQIRSHISDGTRRFDRVISIKG